MRLEIHTLNVLRNEIRAYKSLIKEHDKILEDYRKPLKTLENELLEVEEKLKIIKSPGKGDGLGGFVQDSADKYNYLIDRKDDIRKEISDYIIANEKQVLEELRTCENRIDTIEYYLDQMDSLDRKFIEDFYFNLSKRECMDRYNINNINSLYRKSNKILEKLVKNNCHV